MSKQSLALASTPHPLGKNPLWHVKGLTLPPYIENIAAALIGAGHTESDAISIAVGVIKRWAAGGGKVDAGTRAAAAKALGEWEKARAEAHATSSGKPGSSSRSSRLRAALTGGK